MEIITLIMTGVVLAVTVACCVSDARSLQIPNAFSLVIIGCFVPAFLAMPKVFGPFWQHLLALAVMLGLTYIMFLKGAIGGGDSKFGAAVALWTGLHGLLALVLYMAVMGGVLALVSLGLHKKKLFNNPRPGSWIAEAQDKGKDIPYGIAISAGTWAAFFHTGFLHQQLNELSKIIH